VVASKPKLASSVILPAQVLLPLTLSSAPVPKMPLPERSRGSLTTTLGPPSGEESWSWAPSRTVVPDEVLSAPEFWICSTPWNTLVAPV